MIRKICAIISFVLQCISSLFMLLAFCFEPDEAAPQVDEDAWCEVNRKALESAIANKELQKAGILKVEFTKDAN